MCPPERTTTVDILIDLMATPQMQQLVQDWAIDREARLQEAREAFPAARADTIALAAELRS